MSKRIIYDSGSDVEVVCGEWEIGSTSASLSGEKYNIILPIVDIVRHPGIKLKAWVYFPYKEGTCKQLPTSFIKKLFPFFYLDVSQYWQLAE